MGDYHIKLTSKGQIILPKDVREKMKISTGDYLRPILKVKNWLWNRSEKRLARNLSWNMHKNTARIGSLSRKVRRSLAKSLFRCLSGSGD